jgi:hypothetical protein
MRGGLGKIAGPRGIFGGGRSGFFDFLQSIR